MSERAPLDVLIVEDDQGCVDLIGDVLHDIGFNTIVADSVEGALLVVRSQPLRLIILDVMLADGDGLQVLDAVRSEPGSTSTPIIVCTAAVFELSARRDLSGDPLTALVVKPFHIQSFVKVVSDLLSS